MQSMNKLLDKFSRRTYNSLKKDGVYRVILKLESNQALFLLFLDSDPSTEDCTKLELKYQRIFSDDPDFKIKVIPKTNTVNLNHECYSVWRQETGYIL